MKHLNAEIEHITKKNYAPEVVLAIKALEEMLDAEQELAASFDDVVHRYIVTETLSMQDALAELKQLSEQFGKNEYALDLLLILNSLPHLHEKYRKQGISDEIFYESMDDIRCKVSECVECKGMVGTFVAKWFDGFFKLTRFAYGRFQYEVATFKGDDFTMSCGKTVKEGDKYVTIHIPSNGTPLTNEIRMASYKAAYPHFSSLFEDGIVIFGCSSWLLYPKHREFLPTGANLLKFMDDFEMVRWKETPEDPDKWRIFGKHAALPSDQLPRDTSLRRAYADWLQAGNPTGRGFGIFAFDGTQIIK